MPQSSFETVNCGGNEDTSNVELIINGKLFQVGASVSKTTRLSDFIRNEARLRGTKTMCHEGGCGVCTVVATTPDLERGGTKTFSLQACQAMLYACAGWNIETIEHLGDQRRGYDILQKTLHKFYGTQCGYCSPGMIMTLHGHQKSKGIIKADEVERLLDGNLCRCTGYRPIVDAFKSLAEEVPDYLKDRTPDIEDLDRSRCLHSGRSCMGKCEPCGHEGFPYSAAPLSLTRGPVKWHAPDDLQGVFDILNNRTPGLRYRLVVGNTGQGVYKHDGPYDLYINTSCVKDLYTVSATSAPLVLGANVSLSRAIEVFDMAAEALEGFAYTKALAKHWRVVANVGVRNTGCWAGNLMLKHVHRDFPSDIFLTLLSVGAELTVADAKESSITHVSLEEFLDLDMNDKLILSVTLTPLPSNTVVKSFKITPRAVNAHAYVNACFRLLVDPEELRILEHPTILFGGINEYFIHAEETETFLNGKVLTEASLAQEVAEILVAELKPDSKPQDASPEYRKTLAAALLYKTLLEVIQDKADCKVQSGGQDLVRPPTHSCQEFDTDSTKWPLEQPVPKIESLLQLSGEAQYTNDIEPAANELHGCFVQSSVANARIKSINTSEALKVEGVVTFIGAQDVPGDNYFSVAFGPLRDPLFADERVQYAGEALGLVVARTYKAAKKASTLVQVEYEDVCKPILGIKNALSKGNSTPEQTMKFGDDIQEALDRCPHVVDGELNQGSQYHMFMEPHSSLVLPTEDGYEVFAATQWPSETQAVVSSVLKVPANQVHVRVRRLGGSFGGKISRGNIVTAAAAIAAHKTRCPVRINLDLKTSMTIVGWRDPYYNKYTIGFDNSGKIGGVKAFFVNDMGILDTENSSIFCTEFLANAYTCPSWDVTYKTIFTNTAKNTWARCPGTINVIAAMENMMEHIATYLDMDPLKVREVNLAPSGVPLYPRGEERQEEILKDLILPLLKVKSCYAERREAVETFNKENRWKKRGIGIALMKYMHEFLKYFRYNVHVAIYSHDGTVSVAHGGVEIGQGINTKVAQVVAQTLDIPLDLVKMRPTDSFVGCNSIYTGASFTSDLCAIGARKACEKLKDRLEVVKKKMRKENEKEPTWKELLAYCAFEDIDLTQRYWTEMDDTPKYYDIHGATCLEVEIDVLTGQYNVLRADIIEDCGRSLSPYIDVGQVEGAFVMGLGYYSSEIVKFDEDTGVRLSDGTWEYKPPTAVDIPADFRVTLLPNPNNFIGALRSKATGEPPMCMAYSFVTALRQAIASARADAGSTDWFQMDTPLTVEQVKLLCNTKLSDFTI
ncbi:uncharacterized protein LOC143025623 [Oratosquilla oratoria]|uniref:uncharacterized protein LOC143025623 n=1 Tax=Oratosquilla oratoria TaxID=337810 RepID=UPI003F75B101